MKLNNSIDKYEPRFHGFHDLMQFHIREILIVSSLYDSFILEEDGQLSENIFSDYFDLNLSYAPRITRVSTGEHALEIINSRPFDLIITMMRLSDMDVHTFGKRVKLANPNIPIILLAYESDISSHALKSGDVPGIDKIFVWTGDTKILLAITKLMEDKLNVSHDTQFGNVRVIIVIENSRHYYSLFLPLIYTEIMKQTQSLIAEGLNEMHRQLRRRARPKILLAQNFEEGMEYYEKYKRNILGIISDIRYSRKGKTDPEAGFKFAGQIKSENSEMPLLLMSSNYKNARRADRMKVSFLDKNSPSFLQDLRQFIIDHLGFGDFVFRRPDGAEVGRASSMRDMIKLLPTITDDSLAYHASRNHFSNWLMARTEFTLAEKLRPRKISDFDSIKDLREHLIGSIQDLRKSKQRGVITEFSRLQYDPGNEFIRLSSGSLGGKARGIAFIRALLDKSQVAERFPDVNIKIPSTVVLGTDVFDQFMDDNNLRHLVLEEINDNEITQHFLNARLPARVQSDLKFFLKRVRYPLAVRSSSLLEDSQYQPFAGLYATYMVPNNSKDVRTRLQQLCDAIKLVFASTFYKAPKAYIKALSRSIEEEKMAVIIQELVGQQYGDLFYPSFSGVAQSYNYYPISYLKPEDGIVQVALGLGKIVVDGGKVLRFSPKHPNILPQFSSPEKILHNSQINFFALDLSTPEVKLCKNDEITLIQGDLVQAERDGTLAPIGAVFSPDDNAVYDGIYHNGPRVVTFSHILKSNIFPLSAILSDLLEIGRHGIGSPVQIEFAVNMYNNINKKPDFYFLQIRPMISGSEQSLVDIKNINEKSLFCRTSSALGNGVMFDIFDIVYVKPDAFNAANSVKIAAEIGIMNNEMIKNGRKYLLIGPGRWGSSDNWLGIPVSWEQISNVNLVVETDIEKFSVEPSQGTHFFHNITSFRIGYFTITHNKINDFVDWNWLAKQKAFLETRFVRHLYFSRPVVAKINGRTREGVIIKP